MSLVSSGTVYDDSEIESLLLKMVMVECKLSTIENGRFQNFIFNLPYAQDINQANI